MNALIRALVSIKIHFYDVDPMHVVWHGNYPRFLEVARSALLDKLNYNYPQMKDSGYLWPIVDMRIKYLRPLLFNQTIFVEAGLMEYENRLLIHYEIRDESSNELLTKATTTQVAVKDGQSCLEFESPEIFTKQVERVMQ